MNLYAKELAEFLKAKKIRQNLITKDFEQDGIQLSEDDINDLYLDAQMKIKKLRYNNFFICLRSNRVEKFDPLKEYFKANKDLKPTGNIEALAD